MLESNPSSNKMKAGINPTDVALNWAMSILDSLLQNINHKLGCEMERLSPKEVMEIYKKHGTNITIEEAEKILAFMWEWVNISLDQNFKSNESRFIHPGKH